MKFNKTILQKSNVLALISSTYVISWLIAVAALNVYVIYPAKFAILEGGIYLGALTPLQGTAIILFITAGGLATMCAGWFVVLNIGGNLRPRITAYWKKQEIPIENVPAYNPAQTAYPEQEMHSLELGKSISAITNYLKANPLKTGIPLIIFGPAMWQAFNIYAKIQAPIIGQLPMFQILTMAIPALSILSIVTGVMIIANHYYKKNKKETYSPDFFNATRKNNS
jgi:hypothetical protein